MFPILFKVVICGAMLSWGPVTSGMLQGNMRGSIWFNILISDLEGEIEQSDDRQLGQMPDTTCVSLQAGEMTNGNVMKFEKNKCESSTWRRIIMFTKVGTDWMESRFAEKDLEVLVNNWLDVTQQRALAPEHLELHEVLSAG